MKVRDALKITGSLSKPSKMPGWAYGLPAKECKTGGKLQKVPGSVCFDCYAMKGCYVFKVVQQAHQGNQEPLLFFKYNRSPIFVVVKDKPKNFSLWIDINFLGCHVMVADEWLKNEKPEFLNGV